jgi:hypothetical protein
MQPVIVCVSISVGVGSLPFRRPRSQRSTVARTRRVRARTTPRTGAVRGGRSGSARSHRLRRPPHRTFTALWQPPCAASRFCIWASQKLLRNSRYTQAYGTCLCDNMFVVNVNVNVNELRLCFSNTTRNPEGILSHNNRNSTGVHIVAPTASGNASIAVIQPHVAAPQWPRTRTAVCRLPREHPFLAHLLCVRGPVALLVLQVLRRRHHGNLRLLQGRAPV